MITLLRDNPLSSKQNNLQRVVPIAGFIPWIIFWIFSTLTRYAIVVALIVAVLLIILRYRVETRFMILDVITLLFFTANTIFTFILNSHIFIDNGYLISWLMLCRTAFCSIIAGCPFTIQMAKESVPETFWTSPIFMESNNILTGMWGLIFLTNAIISLIGSSVNNLLISTGLPMIMVIGAMV